MLVVQASGTAPAPSPATTKTTAAGTEQETAIDSGGVGVREFQGDDVGQVLRLLACGADVCAGVYPIKRIDWEKIRHTLAAGLPEPSAAAVSWQREFQNSTEQAGFEQYAAV